MSQDSDSPPQRADPTCKYVVGIGASAGGVEALKKLVHGLPLGAGAAYVVIPHLMPDFDSRLGELLDQETELAVLTAQNGSCLTEDTIHVLPPGKDMILSGDELLLVPQSADEQQSLPIDRFFRSLATARRRFAVAIVLSGAGDDGSRGLVDVHAEGGLVLAQPPESAAFLGMPRSAIDTDLVDVVLLPEDMGHALRTYVEEALTPDALAKQQFGGKALESLVPLLDALKEAHGVDFSSYKPATTLRRVERRRQAAGAADLDAWIASILQDEQELDQILDDLLIGVTRFRRDEEAFRLLERDVLPVLLEQAEEQRPLRVWVAGCSTGEEAYSVLLSIREFLRRRGVDREVRIFATDVNPRALVIASDGIYAVSALDGMEPSTVTRYFERVPDGYQIKSEARQQVVFARHDFTHEPPFTQIDLVLCRNVLIYLQPHAQKRAMELFHFSLRPGGTLFLGPSESVGDLESDFGVVSSRWRIYRRALGDGVSSPSTVRAAAGTRPRPSHVLTGTRASAALSRRGLPSAQDVEQALLRKHFKPSVVVNRAFEIQHLYGGIEKLLQLRSGRMSASLLDMVDQSVAATLSSALRRARQEQAVVTRHRSSLPGESGDGGRVSVERVQLEDETEPLFLISFSPLTFESSSGEPDGAGGDGALRLQLNEARDELRSAVEEVETSNERLQSANDELMASNEELQSTNEELQSVNEELHMVNAEHEKRIEQVSQERADMSNLLTATGVGVIFVDQDLRVRRFTPSIEESFRLVDSDLGRSLETFAHTLEIDDLIGKVEATIKKETVFEAETSDRGGVPYILRITPYVHEGQPTGAVLTLVDISATREISRRLSQFEQIVHHSTDMISLLDAEGRFVFVNAAKGHAHGRAPDELIGLGLDAVDPDWSPERFKELFEEVHEAGAQLFLSRNRAANGRVFPVEVNASPVVIEGERLLFRHSRDVSDRERSARYSAFARQSAILANESAEIVSFVQGLLEAAIRWLGVERAGVHLVKDTDDLATGTWITSHGHSDFTPPSTLLEKGLQLSGAHWTPDLNSEAAPPETLCTICIRSNNRPGALMVLEFGRDEAREADLIQVEPALDVAVRSMSLLINRIESDGARRLRDRALDASSNGIAIADATQPDMPLIYVNHGFEAMTGYTRQDVIGKNCRFLQGSETDPEARMKLARAVSDGEAVRVTLLNYRKDGDPFWNDLHISPVVSDDGGVREFVAVQHDITERIENERDLQIARQKAAAASRAKSRFLATVSHEIRSPMTAIVGFVDSIGRKVEEPETLQSLAAIRRNADYLLRLIGDILDMSRIESGKLEVATEQVDLPLLIRDVGELMSVRSDEKHLGFTTELETPVPRFAMTDPIRIRQILVNLLSNAIKFTERGEIKLVVRFFNDAQPRMEFDVTDTGIGIPLEARDRIFKPFVRPHTDDDHDTHYDGAGLGLSIVRRLLSAFGGEISVQSREGRGTQFRTTVPMAAAEPVEWCSSLDDLERPPAPSSWGDENEDLLDNVQVLVADDRADVARVIQFYLEDAGAQVTVVHDGRQAVDAFLEVRETASAFDVIVLDMQMPVLDGYGAARLIRTHDEGTPIIALTAGAGQREEDRAIKAGCTAFLAKPAEEATLLRLVARLGRGVHGSGPPKSDTDSDSPTG